MDLPSYTDNIRECVITELSIAIFLDLVSSKFHCAHHKWVIVK